MNKQKSGKIIKRLIPALLLGCVILTGTACSSQEPESESLKVTVPDVGKGDCILIEKGGTSILIDSGYDSTSDEVISFLKKETSGRLDYFIVTHYDKDHVGGAAAVAKNLEIGQIYLPDYEGESKYYTAFMEAIAEKIPAVERVSENISFTLSGVSYEIYASDIEYSTGEDGSEGNDNDVSLVISAKWNGNSYLFAGDIEKKGIKSFLQKNAGTFDVVKMPHHGREESNTDDFIESTQPKTALITDSEDDPAEDEVLALLEEAGAKVYRSSQCGTITITSTGNGEYAVTTEKN